MRSLPLLLGAALCACGSSSPPPVSPATTVSSAAPSTPASAAGDEAPAPRFHAVDLTSACPHDMHIYFGDHPGDGNGQAATATSGATIPVPRGPDGSVVVWVVDDQGFGLASVHVTKNMRHVRIDATCSKLDADSTR